MSDRSHLNAVRKEIEGPYGRLEISEATVGPLRPIALGPGLLVYLDRQKRQRLLETWETMTEPNQTTEQELMQTICAHPTLSEMMHESTLDAYGRAIHY